MQKLVLLCCLCSAIALPAAAQDYPRVETFGGYNYLHSSFPGQGLNFNGASSSVAVNLTPIFAIVGDLGGYHENNLGIGSTQFTYLFGPQFAARSNVWRVQPFFHVLLGGAHLSSSSSSGSTSSSGSSSENAFALASGGGIDVHVSPHVAIRVAQVDYLLTKFKDDRDNRQNNVRVSAGIVFRWGGESSPRK